MKTINSDYSRLKDADFSTVAGTIHTNMNDNDNFSSLQTDVDALKPVIEKYNELLQLSVSRDRSIIIRRNTVRSSLSSLLKDLGKKVEGLATSDEQLASTGFLLSKEKASTPPLTTPALPVLLQGVNRGELVCTSKRQKGMTAFTFFITDDPETGKWEAFTSSRRKFVFTALYRNTEYYIRYSISGVRNQLVMSETVSISTQ